jgi:hypothetical protein
MNSKYFIWIVHVPKRLWEFFWNFENFLSIFGVLKHFLALFPHSKYFRKIFALGPATEVWLRSLNFPCFARRAAHYILLAQKSRSLLMLPGLLCSRVVLMAQPSLQPSLARLQALSSQPGPLRPDSQARQSPSEPGAMACQAGRPGRCRHRPSPTSVPCTTSRATLYSVRARPANPSSPTPHLASPLHSAAAGAASRRPWRPPPSLFEIRRLPSISAHGEHILETPSSPSFRSEPHPSS